MSRSRHNKSKAANSYEFSYQGQRAGNMICGQGPGKYGGAWVKTNTHRLERRAAKRELRKDEA